MTFSPPLELDEELFGKLTGPPRLSLAVISATALFVPKYTKKDLQRILKTVLEARAPTTSENLEDKP